MYRQASLFVVTTPSWSVVAGLLFASMLMLFAPGFFLTRLLLGRRGLSWLLRLPLAIALSIGLVTLLATMVLIAKLPLSVLLGLVTALALGLALLDAFRRQQEDRTERSEADPWFLGAFALVSVLVIVLFALPLERINSPGDFWAYLGFVRKWATLSQRPAVTVFTGNPQIPATDFRYTFGGWILAQSLLSVLSGVDPIDLSNWWLPLVLMVTAYFGLFSLAETLFRNRNAAILTVLVQAMSVFIKPDYGKGSLNTLGSVFFWRINEDKYVVAFVMLPLATLLMIRFLRQRRKGDLICFLLLALAMSFLHPLGVIWTGGVCGFFAALHWLLNRRKETALRLAYVLLPLVMLLIVPFTQRRAFNEEKTLQDEKAHELISYVLQTPAAQVKLRTTFSDRILVLDASRNLYLSHPDLLNSPVVIVALLLTPLLLLYVKKDLGAQFLFANMAGWLFLLYNPILTPFLGRLVTPWMLWRFVQLLPTSLVLGFFLGKTYAAYRRRARLHSLAAPLLLGTLLLATMVLLACKIIQWPTAYPGPEGLFTEARRDLFLQARRFIREPSVVMCAEKSRIGFMLPAFIPRGYVPTWREQGLLKTSHEDALRFYETDIFDDVAWQILQKHNCRYVIAGQEQIARFSLAAPFLSLLYSNGEYALFQVAELPNDHPFVVGNAHFAQGEWPQAVEAYQQAAQDNPLLARLRLAQAQAKKGDVSTARAIYQESLSLYPDNPWLHFYLAELERSAGFPDVALHHYTETLQLAEPTRFLPSDIMESLRTIAARGLSLLTATPPEGADHLRWGVTARFGSTVASYPVQLLPLGWFTDARIREVSPNLPFEHVQVVSLVQGSRPPSLDMVGRAARSRRGVIWLIGAWPEWDHMGNLTPEAYAEWYHDLYYAIKGRDLAAMVFPGGITQVTPLRLQWLDRMLEAYRNRYHEELPADGWQINIFILREEKGSWGVGIPVGLEAEQGVLYEIMDNADPELLKEQVLIFRKWMAEHNWQRKPLVIASYGVQMPSEYLGEGDAWAGDLLIREYMKETFDFLNSARDQSLGYPADNGRLVQRWAWHSLNELPYDPETGQGNNGMLFLGEKGPEIRLTTFGALLADYLLLLQR